MRQSASQGLEALDAAGQLGTSRTTTAVDPGYQLGLPHPSRPVHTTTAPGPQTAHPPPRSERRPHELVPKPWRSRTRVPLACPPHPAGGRRKTTTSLAPITSNRQKARGFLASRSASSNRRRARLLPPRHDKAVMKLLAIPAANRAETAIVRHTAGGERCTSRRRTPRCPSRPRSPDSRPCFPC